jgi:8-oxo-dGTP pyrophosphatase MutT (NUDIX family)
MLHTPSKVKHTYNSKNNRNSAVVIPIIDINNIAHVLLCKRPTYLHHHPGEICLPGGKFEEQDKHLAHTALRELKEELNITSSCVKLIGKLPTHSTLTGFNISPFLGVVAENTVWENDINEVQASFLVPITQLVNASLWQPLPFTRNGKTIILQGFVTQHGLLWGATANIINNFTKQLAIPV